MASNLRPTIGSWDPDASVAYCEGKVKVNHSFHEAYIYTQPVRHLPNCRVPQKDIWHPAHQGLSWIRR